MKKKSDLAESVMFVDNLAPPLFPVDISREPSISDECDVPQVPSGLLSGGWPEVLSGGLFGLSRQSKSSSAQRIQNESAHAKKAGQPKAAPLDF
ncbi:hypothetical protein [Chromobacterium haemolyticum]|uniref:hypothetical protein n=1 Tax=Chromobacterium TaxID=535 RepID=UPI0040565410